MIIKVYTDGACSKNPGPGGYAAVILDSGEIKETIKGYSIETTNNEMELMAVEKAIQKTIQVYSLDEKIKDQFIKHRIEIYTDSAYVVNSINEGWLGNWHKNSWVTKKGTAVKNKLLWVSIYELNRKYNIRFIHVKGHNGNKFNEHVDKIAQGMAGHAKGLI